jgi:hypothetical protein
VFRAYGPGPTLWESVLPAEALRMPAELARVDELPDDQSRSSGCTDYPARFVAGNPSHRRPICKPPSCSEDGRSRLATLRDAQVRAHDLRVVRTISALYLEVDGAKKPRCGGNGRSRSATVPARLRRYV